MGETMQRRSGKPCGTHGGHEPGLFPLHQQVPPGSIQMRYV
jgi:hypothetical protein